MGAASQEVGGLLGRCGVIAADAVDALAGMVALSQLLACFDE